MILKFRSWLNESGGENVQWRDTRRHARAYVTFFFSLVFYARSTQIVLKNGTFQRSHGSGTEDPIWLTNHFLILFSIFNFKKRFLTVEVYWTRMEGKTSSGVIPDAMLERTWYFLLSRLLRSFHSNSKVTVRVHRSSGCLSQSALVCIDFRPIKRHQFSLHAVAASWRKKIRKGNVVCARQWQN